MTSNNNVHPDDVAIDAFAEALKAKMKASRDKGRSGWGNKLDCPDGVLQQMLVDHLGKGDPIDIGVFAMMIYARGEKTSQYPNFIPVGLFGVRDDTYVHVTEPDDAGDYPELVELYSRA